MYGRELRGFHHAYYHGTYVLRTGRRLSYYVRRTDWPLCKDRLIQRKGQVRPGDDASPLGEDASPLGERVTT